MVGGNSLVRIAFLKIVKVERMKKTYKENLQSISKSKYDDEKIGRNADGVNQDLCERLSDTLKVVFGE